MKKCINIIFLIYTQCLIAQHRPLNSWQDHFNYNDIQSLTSSSTEIFASAGNGLLVYKFSSTDPVRKLSTINGLYSGYITALEWDYFHEKLFIGYADGTIQLLDKSDMITFTTLRDANTILEKRINSFWHQGDKTYIASSLGVAVFDHGFNSISDVFQDIGPEGTKLNVREIVLLENQVFITSDLGLSYSSISDNLFDFNNWRLLPNTSLTSRLTIDDVNKLIYLIQDDNYLLRINENDALDTIYQSNSRLIDLTIDNNFFILSEDSIIRSETEEFISFLKSPANNPTSFLDNGDLYIGDASDGLLSLSQSTSELKKIRTSGPVSDKITSIEFKSGSLTIRYDTTILENKGRISLMSNGVSQNIDLQGYNVYDAMQYENSLFLGTHLGLYDYSMGDVISSTEGDSIISLSRYRESLIFGNLSKDYSLGFFDGSSVDKFESNLTGAATPTDIGVYQQSQIWMKRLNGNGLAIWNPEENLFNSISGSDGIGNSNILDYDFSYDDEAWVLTSSGIYSVFDIRFIFDGKSISNILFEGDPILENEKITSIVIDGGNRRWIGTGNGLWMFNDILDEQLNHFTIENSPLPSNQIKQLAYDEDSGLLYILTDAGLVSFQTDSKKPLPSHSDVKIFPNPINLGVHQALSISDVVENATIKITTTNGTLVNQIKANGSYASWDLRHINGNKVSTGVYLLFSSDNEGSETYIGKLAVME